MGASAPDHTQVAWGRELPSLDSKGLVVSVNVVDSAEALSIAKRVPC